MVFTLAWAALRRHPFSMLCTALLVVLSASLFGARAPLAVVVWATTSLIGIMVWLALEPVILRRLGGRSPSPIERAQLEVALQGAQLEVVVLDAPEPWLGRGMRSLVISRALLDLLSDRAVLGVVWQSVQQVRAAGLAGELVVWLGNVPLVSACLLDGLLLQVGRLLAIVVGASLVLPLLLWPTGFVRWIGRLFGLGIVGLVGAALLSNGWAAPGLGFLVAWAIVPGLQALLTWEFRRAERLADLAVVDAGLGWHLLDALETLAFAESLPPPSGLLGVLCRRGYSPRARADRLWRALSKQV